MGLIDTLRGGGQDDHRGNGLGGGQHSQPRGALDDFRRAADTVPLIGGLLGGFFGAGQNRLNQAEQMYGGVDPTGGMQQGAANSAQFARIAAGNYGAQTGNLARQQQMQAALAGRYGRLAGQYGNIASGQNSISAEQLRQGLQQAQAQQASMAAGAAPGNQVMAARNAALNMGQNAVGSLGTQALAGLQERQNALAAQAALMGGQGNVYGQMQQGALTGRAQDVQGMLGAQQNANTALGNIEDARTERYKTAAGSPTQGEQDQSIIQNGIKTVVGLFSDRRLKKGIAAGDEDVEAFMSGLKAYKYRYKDAAHGRGEFVGPMAQDLERTRAGKGAVVETAKGKAVDTGRLALTLAGASANLHRRLKELESRGRAS